MRCLHGCRDCWDGMLLLAPASMYPHVLMLCGIHVYSCKLLLQMQLQPVNTPKLKVTIKGLLQHF